MVFDTNVVAYGLLGVQPHADQSLASLAAAPSVWVPSSFRAEVLSAVWQWVRFGTVSLDDAQQCLRDAERIITHVVSVEELWEQALLLALERNHSSYDTLFVALAIREGLRVITYDAAVLARFPEWTLSPEEYLAQYTSP